MARGAWIRRAGLIGLALAAGACEDIAQPPNPTTTSLAVLPNFDAAGGGSIASVDQLRIVIDQKRPSGDFTNVVDTTLAIDPGAGTIEVDLEVPLAQDPQVFRVTLQASLGGVVLYAGSSEISVSRSDANTTPTVEVPVVWAGPPFEALTLSPRDTIVPPGSTFDLQAFVFDSTGQSIPAPLVSFKLLNPTDSTQMTISEDGTITVSQTALTTAVIVVAETPDTLIDQALIQIGDFVARRRWVVNPAAAQPFPTQWGTDEYPFSTIGRGLNRAGIRDTVAVAVDTYTEALSGTRPVILLGDSNAAGVPTIMSPGPSGTILSPTGAVDLHRMRFQGATGPLTIRGTSINMTSVEFTDVAGPAMAIIQSGPTTIRGLTIDGVTGGPLGRGLEVMSTAGLNLRSADISNTDAAGIRAESMGFIHIAASELQQTGMVNDTAFGIEVAFTDSVRIDSVRVHDTNGGGIAVGGATILTARGDSIYRTHVNAEEPNGFTDRTAFFAQDVLVGRIVDASITDNVAAGVLVFYTNVNGSVAIDSSTLTGDYWGIRGFGPSTSIGRVTAEGNTITGRLGGPLTRGIGLGPLRTMIVQGNQISSVSGEGIFPAPGDSVIIRKNTLLGIRPDDSTAVITGLATRIAQIDSNSVDCDGSTAAFGIAYHEGSGMIDFNTVTGCTFGGYSNASSGEFDLFIRSNSFTTGQGPAVPSMGYQVQGQGYHVEMRENNVSGGVYDPFGALVVLGGPAGMRSARMISNVVGSATGRGLSIQNVDTVIVDSNTVSFLDSIPGNVLPAIQTSGVLEMGRYRYNQITNNSTQGFYFGGVATDVAVDSNTITNNAGPGIWLDQAATLGVDAVNASFNLIGGQFNWGVLVTAMGGSFRNNDFIGNFIGLENQHSSLVIDATLSYWNNPLGPQCAGALTGCDVETSGDFVSGVVPGSVVFIPVSSSPNVVLPGPGSPPTGNTATPQRPGAVAWVLTADVAARLDGTTRVGGGARQSIGRALQGFPR